MSTSHPNWVSDRAKCNVDLAFRALVGIIERDVAEANRLERSSLKGRRFEITRGDKGLEVACRPPPNSVGITEPTVTFEKSSESIEVHCNGGNPFNPDPTLEFEVVPTWDKDSATCEFHIDNQPYKAWQISQRALETLFFDT